MNCKCTFKSSLWVTLDKFLTCNVLLKQKPCKCTHVSVPLRIHTQNFKSPYLNVLCDEGCIIRSFSKQRQYWEYNLLSNELMLMIKLTGRHSELPRQEKKQLPRACDESMTGVLELDEEANAADRGCEKQVRTPAANCHMAWPSAFTLSEMENHWRILNKVTWINMFIMINMTILLRKDWKSEYKVPARCHLHFPNHWEEAIGKLGCQFLIFNFFFSFFKLQMYSFIKLDF